MSHPLEILANAVNLALGLGIILLVLELGRVLLRVQPEVLTARLFFAQDRFVLLVILLLLGLLVFAVSNAFELYGDVAHIDWTVNEVIEAFSLAILLVSLARLRRVLLPIRGREVVPVPEEGP